ncbi:hypothetical protein [Agrobacterium sp. NPDC089420]|uniref:hypothetical protein n=1 Tax=Agrobacterium sp. NPDC089420 TaxID=3363918 RepID=UPI00384F79A8
MALKYLALIGCIGLIATGWWALDIKVLFLLSALITIPAFVSVFVQSVEGGETTARESRFPGVVGAVTVGIILLLTAAYMWLSPQITSGQGAQDRYENPGADAYRAVGNAEREAQRAAEDAEAALKKAVQD